MCECSTEQFYSLKKEYESLQKNPEKTKAEQKKISAVTQKLNACAEKLVKEIKFTDAFNWLCEQKLCLRKNCECSRKHIEVSEQSGISFRNLKLVENAPEQPAEKSEPAPKKIPTKKQIESALKPLDALIGMPKIKEQVTDFIKSHIISLKREKLGLPAAKSNMHMVFTGNPGTGKTECARIIAGIFKNLGLVNNGHFVEVDRGDLIGEYIGWTEWKVKEKIKEAMGGVLFIDEAYALNNSSSNDFGHEAVATLLKAMEDHRGNFVVIAAGYPKEMESFLKMNPGLKSRFAHNIHFEDYAGPDLALIFEKFCNDQQYELTNQAREKLQAGFKQIKNLAEFDNARGARNLFERTTKNQARRAYDANLKTQKEFMTIMPEDIDFGFLIKDMNLTYLSGRA